MLQGFHYPLTPKGKSTLNPPPPWHYSADFLDIEFWADPRVVAALLPPGLDSDPSSEGHCNGLFYDWQFTGANDEYLDPERYQYRMDLKRIQVGANPIWRRLFTQEMRLARSLAPARAGSSRAARMAIMAMTTRSSMRVNAPRFFIGVNVFMA